MKFKLLMLAIAIAIPVAFIIWALDPSTTGSDDAQGQGSFSMSKGQNHLPKLPGSETC